MSAILYGKEEIYSFHKNHKQQKKKKKRNKKKGTFNEVFIMIPFQTYMFVSMFA